MVRFLCIVLLTSTCFVGCQGQSKEELLHESGIHVQQGNHRGALVLLKTALEKDPSYQPARLALADIYLSLGQPDTVLSELKKAEVHGLTPELIELRAEAYLQKGMTSEALSALNDLPEENQQSSKSLAIRGRAYAYEEKWSVAESSLRRAVAANIDNQMAHLNLCRVLERQKKPAETEVCLKDHNSKWPSLPEGVLFLAQFHIQNTNIDEAVIGLESFVEAGHVNDEVLYRLGTLYLQRRELDKSRAVVESIKTQTPKSRYGHLLAGQNALLSRNLDVALEELTFAAKIKRDNVAEFMLGLARFELAQYEQALNHFQNALDQDPDFHQARLMVASTLLKQKRYDDALNSAETVLRVDPNNLQALRIAASGYMVKENFDKADQFLQRAIQIAPDQQDLYLEKSEFEFLAGNVTGSMDTLKKALAKDPSNLRARLYLVAGAARRQNYQYAMEIINDGLTGKPTDAVLKNMLGRLYLAQDRPQMALKAFVAAKQAQPTFKAPYFNLAQMALKNADYPAAMGHFDEVLQFSAEDITALMNKARLQELLGDSENALNNFIKVRDLGAPEGFLALASFYSHKGRFNDALATLEEGSTRHPKKLDLLEMKAALYREKGDFDSAIQVYRDVEQLQAGRGFPAAILIALEAGKNDTALNLINDTKKRQPESAYGYLLESIYHEKSQGPKQALDFLNSALPQVFEKQPLYRRMALLSDRLGDTESAMKAVRKWVRSDTENYLAHFSLGVYLERLGEVQQAAESYKTCLQLNESYVPALNNLAYLYTDKMGRPGDALPLAQKAVALSPGNGSILDTLGYVHYNLGEYRQAKDMLQKAVNVYPDQGQIRVHLAQALIKLGENVEAKTQLEAALGSKIMPQRKEAEQLLQSLN